MTEPCEELSNKDLFTVLSTDMECVVEGFESIDVTQLDSDQKRRLQKLMKEVVIR